jgi:hypothetical protein
MKGTMMRTKVVVPTLLALLLAGACTASEDEPAAQSTTTAADADDGASGETSTTVGEAATGPSPGVTDDAIRVGITYVDLDAVRQFVDLDQGDYEATYQVLIDEVNAAGGINGRQVEPVFAPVSPLGTVPAEEVCVRLTEDEDVFAVIGFFQDDAVLCPLEAHQTAVIGGVVTGPRHDRASAPWFSTDAGSDDSEAAGIEAMAEAGELDGTIGVFGSILNESQVNDVVLPLLEELGVEAAETAILDAPQDDLAAQNQATAVIAERFRSANVDTVLVVGSAAVPLANGLAPLDFRPRLLFTSVVAVNGYTSGIDPDLSMFEGAVLASVDNEVFDETAMQDCLATLVDAGVIDEYTDPDTLESGAANPFVSASAACRNFNLFVTIAEAAGPELNYGTFQAAGEALGQIHLPGAEDDYEFGPYPSIDGDLPLYLLDWDAAEDQFNLRED